jgi:hypothetical protein
MSKYKKIGIAAGAAVVIAGASAGGYMLLNKGGDDTTESSEDADASASDDSDEAAPMASIAEAIPQNVDLYVEIPSVRALAQGSAKMKFVDVGLLDLLKTLDEVGAGFGKAFGMTAKDGSALVSSFKSVALAGRFDAAPPLAGAVVSSDKPALVKKLLATKRFTKDGKVGDLDKYTLGAAESGDASDDMYTKLAGGLATPPDTGIVWIADKGLLVMGSEPFLEGVASVSAGKAKALSASADYKKDIRELDKKPRMFAYAPANALNILAKNPSTKETLDGFLKDPGPFLWGVYMDAPGILMTVQGGLGGEKVPVMKIPAAPKLDIGGKLPKDTVGYFAFSTKLDFSGSEAEKKIVDLLKTYDPSAAPDFEKEMGEARTKLGLGLSEFFDAVGDQLVVGVVSSEKDLGPEDFENLNIEKNFAVIGLQALKDEAGMKKLVDALKKVAPIGKTHTVTATADGGFEASAKTSGPFIAVRYLKGDLFVGVGAETLVKSAQATIEAGTDTLASEKAHQLGLSGIKGNPHVVSWFDASRMIRKTLTDPNMAMLKELGDLPSKLLLTGDNRFTMTNAVGLEQQGKGYRYRLDMLNSMGVLPALGIYGVRRYLASSKTSEAKNTIGAISRGAAAAFERESAGGTGHKLCKSAPAVPSTVPSGKKYQPDTTAGNDYESGDAETGWRCLKFSMTQPHYFQYGYSAGGPYKGPAVGGPDPGASGFEAWAIGDLDGDGVTSLFTRIGTVNATTGKLKMSTQVFIHNEFE